jgi:two-component system chemotaxis response regulator CheY
MTHAESQTDLSRLRVLLVDDNAALRGALRVSLHAFGCGEVIEADTVDRALETMAARPVDLVITDWKMRPRDGIDLVRTLRRSGATRRPWLPVIMLSAYSDGERIAEARRAGVDTFLVKPFTAASLAASLRETLILETGLCESIPLASNN